MKPTRLAFAVASVFGGSLALAAGPALAATLVVHQPTDTHCGNGSPFVTIQSAVDAASSGDNVQVCPGTYAEQVTIPAGKNKLTLVSTRPLQAVIQAPPTIIAVSPKAIVHVNGANDTRIREFTITGPGPSGCDSIENGVRVDGGGSAEIEGNHITKIEDTLFSGCQNGVAIQVGRQAEGTTGSADINNNLIDNYQKNGITVDNTGSNATIEDNVIRGAGPTGVIAQNGIQISRGATARVQDNFVSDNVFTGSPGEPAGQSTGVLLFNPGAVNVNSNAARANDNGIYALGTDRHTTLDGNSATRSIFDGIALDGVTGSTVSDNDSSDNTAANGQGFDLFDGTSGARLDNNTGDNNATNGFFADVTTSGNTLSNNEANGNGNFDCQDKSTGTGTAGTANFWLKDQGATSDPAGICQAKQHGHGHDDGQHHHDQPNASH
jgi:parallel beta-helix repeat protein